MGDRGNIIVTDGVHAWTEDACGVTVYAHWGGWRIVRTARNALRQGSGRWTDPSYLAATVVRRSLVESAAPAGPGTDDSTPTDPHDRGALALDLLAECESTTSLGLSVAWDVGDNEYPIVVIDTWAQRLRVATESREEVYSWPFAEVVAWSDQDCAWDGSGVLSRDIALAVDDVS